MQTTKRAGKITSMYTDKVIQYLNLWSNNVYQMQEKINISLLS